MGHDDLAQWTKRRYSGLAEPPPGLMSGAVLTVLLVRQQRCLAAESEPGRPGKRTWHSLISCNCYMVLLCCTGFCVFYRECKICRGLVSRGRTNNCAEQRDMGKEGSRVERKMPGHHFSYTAGLRRRRSGSIVCPVEAKECLGRCMGDQNDPTELGFSDNISGMQRQAGFGVFKGQTVGILWSKGRCVRLCLCRKTNGNSPTQELSWLVDHSTLR